MVQPLVAPVLALVVLTGTSTLSPLPSSSTVHFATGTTTATPVSGVERVRPRSQRPRTPQAAPAATTTLVMDVAPVTAQLTWLHDESGLTWDQVARIVGVSRRAVHQWLNGGRLSASHLERVSGLVGVVRQLDVGDRESRRQKLFAIGDDGSSLVDSLVAGRAGGRERISDPGYQPHQLLGALHDEELR